jgi:hypothetical protein
MEGSGNGDTAVYTENKIEASGAGRPLGSFEFDDQQRIAKKAKVESEEDSVDPTNNTQGGSYSMLSALPGLNGGNGEFHCALLTSLVTFLVSFAL